MKTKLLKWVDNYFLRHFNWIKFGLICGMSGFTIVAFLFLMAPIQAETKNESTESFVITDPNLPDGYVHFGDGSWISDSEWVGLVIDADGVSGIPGNSKECEIYEMKIYQIGQDLSYSVVPVLEMDGTATTIPYDGHAFG